jgi:hypothetical protein
MDEYHFLGYNTMFSVEGQLTFRRKISPRASYHLLPHWFLSCLIHRRWRWRRYVPPKRRLTFSGLHGFISQKIVLLIGRSYTWRWKRLKFGESIATGCPWQLPRSLRHELSSPAQTLGSWVPIALQTWMSVCVYSVCDVLCRQRPWDGLVPYIRSPTNCVKIKKPKLKKRARSNKGL